MSFMGLLSYYPTAIACRTSHSHHYHYQPQSEGKAQSRFRAACLHSSALTEQDDLHLSSSEIEFIREQQIRKTYFSLFQGIVFGQVRFFVFSLIHVLPPSIASLHAGMTASG